MVSRLFVFDLFFRVRLFFIGLVQQVINAGMIEVCQLDEDTGGNISFSQFIMRICNLRTVQIIRKVFLIQIMVFPQISDFVGIASSTSIFLLLYDKIRVEIDK